MSQSGSSGISAAPTVGLPGYVARIFYRYGLFAAWHPHCLAAVVLTLAAYLSEPLISAHLPGNSPHVLTESVTNGTYNESNTSARSPPFWLSQPPVAYVLQVLVRAAVTPWREELTVSDAYRASLSLAFQLSESVTNFQLGNSSVLDRCLRVEEPQMSGHTFGPSIGALLPRYNCLLLSPALLWNNSLNAFAADADIAERVLQAQRLVYRGVSVADLVFGVPVRQTAFSLVSGRHRVVSYGVTLLFDRYDPELVVGLRQHLLQHHPHHVPENTALSSSVQHLHFPSRVLLYEPLPVVALCLALSTYMYFSLRKLPSVVGKRRLSLYTFVSLLATLTSCAGLLVQHGLLQRCFSVYDPFPYLLAVVAFENSMVLTTAVAAAGAVRSSRRLQPRIRVAQAVGRHGWSIAKNALLQLTVITAGVLSLVPVVQRFCARAGVGVLCDLLLQLGFFLPVLSLDVRRQPPLSPTDGDDDVDGDGAARRSYADLRFRFPIGPDGVLFQSVAEPMDEVRDGGDICSHRVGPVSVVSSRYRRSSGLMGRLPRRIRLFFLWARMRLLQRALSAILVAWILLMAYNSGLLNRIAGGDTYNSTATSTTPRLPSFQSSTVRAIPAHRPWLAHRPAGRRSRLPARHWSALLRLYNISVESRRIIVLPSIRLSLPVEPQEALASHSPLDTVAQSYRFSRLEFNDYAGYSHATDDSAPEVDAADILHAPTSPTELALLVILALPSVAFITYLSLLLYRCMCSRNYAQWRASWTTGGATCNSSSPARRQTVLEALPVRLTGHRQPVECLATDGQLVASCCLRGQLRVWDPATGCCIRRIDRKCLQDCDGVMTSSMTCSRQNSDCHQQAEHTTDGARDYCRLVSKEAPLLDWPSIEATSSPGSSGRPGYDFTAFVGERGEPLRRSLSFTRPHSVSSAPLRPLAFSISQRSDETPPIVSRLHQRTASADFPAPRSVASGESLLSSSPSVSEQRDRGSLTSDSPVDDPVGDVTSPPLWSTDCPCQPVWCLDFADCLLAVGCSRGAIELWDSLNGSLRLSFTDNSVPVTHIRLLGAAVVIARFDGTVHIHRLQAYRASFQLTWQQYRNARSGEAASSAHWAGDVELRWSEHATITAHQQPISVLDHCAGRLVTGGLDHTLRVHRLSDASLAHTLQGHCGPITACFLDRCQTDPLTGGSGSADGILAVWDLSSGLCLYSVLAHDGAVSSLSCNASCVLSLGADERLCIWERFGGNLINTIELSQTYCSQVILLTPTLCVTSRQNHNIVQLDVRRKWLIMSFLHGVLNNRQDSALLVSLFGLHIPGRHTRSQQLFAASLCRGSLVVWDMELGKPVRLVRLGDRDSSVFVHQMSAVGDAIVCDYGTELRLVRFPPAPDYSKKMH